MQSSDEHGKVVQSDILNDLYTAKEIGEINQLLKQKPDERQRKSIPQQIRDLAQKAEKKGAVRHVIANLPNQGQEVEMGGLKFRVSYVNNHRGDVHLKLVGIEETADEPVADEASGAA